MENEPTEKKMPEKKFKAGAITATVWSNEGQSKAGEAITFSSVAIERNYKDKEGNWNKTASNYLEVYNSL